MHVVSAGPRQTADGALGWTKRRSLLASCVAHALHDGYTDLIYVLLPIWQTQFGIGYAALAVLRALYMGALAGLQLPSNKLAERFGDKTILVLGTAVAAIGYAIAGLTASLLGLGVALALAGAGSSSQHPIGSGIICRAYPTSHRTPLGIYNFAGDLGKAVLPSAGSLLLVVLPWHKALWVIAILGLAVAMLLMVWLPNVRRSSAQVLTDSQQPHSQYNGFSLLFVIGILDTGVRMGLLIFLPFILKAKGASIPMIGMAFGLVFIGGAGGKFICGWLGDRLGVLWGIVLTEVGTAASIFLLLILPFSATLILLPLLGALLNGTSSVLYGTVPEVASTSQTEHAFAIFYTGVIGSAALFPIVYGFVGDIVGINWATIIIGLSALLIVPLAFWLESQLRWLRQSVRTAG